MRDIILRFKVFLTDMRKYYKIYPVKKKPYQCCQHAPLLFVLKVVQAAPDSPSSEGWPWSDFSVSTFWVPGLQAFIASPSLLSSRNLCVLNPHSTAWGTSLIRSCSFRTFFFSLLSRDTCVLCLWHMKPALRSEPASPQTSCLGLKFLSKAEGASTQPINGSFWVSPG